MGGLGKTTLAKKVYDSKDLRDMFGIYAWISVSQSFSRIELLKEMIRQLFGANSLKIFLEDQGPVLQVQYLVDYMCRRLEEQRYLIVLDDVWTIEAWNSIKLIFPYNSKEGSCVVVTTRNGELTEVCSLPLHIHRLEFLKKEDARILFLKKINKALDDLQNMDTIEKILDKCGGLPLAIVTIGSLLANKPTKEWENLYNQLPSELQTNPSLEALNRVVNLSYNHLPSHLKPCFLYLSIFPEDFEIKRKPLLNRWIAEGFVASGDMTRRTLEEVAERYFYELISRSMIQPSKLNDLGDIRTCRVHDIVRDIALSISRAENNVFIVEEHTSTTASTKQSIRHLSCFAEKNLNTGLALSGVRSLTLFNNNTTPLASFCLSRFKMLRVLDLGYGGFKGRKQPDTNIIGSLIHLRYLRFPSDGFYALPRSIGNLKGLQTLELPCSDLTVLPKEITKLQNLRNLYVYGLTSRDICFDIYDYRECLTSVPCPPWSFGDNMCCCCCYSYVYNFDCVRVPEGIRRLKDLQILESVDIRRSSGKAIKELGELTQLRKLSVKGANVWDKKCRIFSVALEKLSSLRSLLVFGDRDTLNKLVSITSPLPFLERLMLDGHLGKIPAWIGQSVNLMKITLMSSEVKEVEALAELPNLMLLRLYGSAYSGERLVFRTHAFPKLKSLVLGRSRNLREVTFEEGTSPHMESIHISYVNLTSGLNGIKNLNKLNEISIGYCTLARKDTLQGEVDTHPNHPVLRMMHVTTIGPAITEEEHEVITIDAVESLSETGESSQS